MPTRRSEQQIMLNPDEQNMRRLFRVRIFQIFIFAVLGTIVNVGVELDKMEDALYYFFWPADHFFPSIPMEMWTQEKYSQIVTILV